MIRPTRTFLGVISGAALLTAVEAHSATFARMSSIFDDPRYFVALWGLSGDGSTAAGTIELDFSTLDPEQEAIRWTREGGIQRLGFLPGGQVSEAYHLTPDGSRISGYSTSTAGSEAFLWDEASGMQPLEAPTTESIGRITWPGPLTADGQTLIGRRRIGWAYQDYTRENLPIYEPYVWKASEGVRSLGEIDPSLAGASLSGISRDGTELIGQMGGVDEFGLGHGPFFIRTEGRSLEIVDLPPGATSTAYVLLSADGSTIVARFLTGEGETARSITEVFTRGKGWGHLPDVQGVDAAFYPGSVSADGRLVAGYVERFVNGEFEDTAVLWDPDHGLRSLRDYLESQGLDLTGIDLTSTTALSDDGSTITGFLRDSSGRFDSFVAVIPEPGPLVLLGFGLAALRAFAPTSRGASARTSRGSGSRTSGPRACAR